MEYVTNFSTLFVCLINDSSLELAKIAFVALSFRHLGIIIGHETSRYLIYYNGSRVAMILGAFSLLTQTIVLFLVREAILSIQASKGLLIVSYFFAGIGTVWIEEGFYSYLGADLHEV